jgi:hypothetical protein
MNGGPPIVNGPRAECVQSPKTFGSGSIEGGKVRFTDNRVAALGLSIGNPIPQSRDRFFLGCITLRVVSAAFEMFRDVDETPIRCSTFADLDALGNDVTGGFVGCVDHFCPGILMLTIAGQSNALHKLRRR